MTPEASNKGQARTFPRLALFIFCLSTLAPAAAQAATERNGIGFNIGEVLLMGQYSDTFNNGLGLGGTYSYEVTDMFGLLGRFTSSGHTNNSGTNTLNIIGLLPDLRVN